MARLTYSDGRYYFWIGADSLKARNIRRHPRIAVSIASPEEPYGYVLAEGPAEITRSGVPERCYSICRRYYDEERAAEFVNRDLESGDSLVLVLMPEKLLTESAA